MVRLLTCLLQSSSFFRLSVHPMRAVEHRNRGPGGIHDLKEQDVEEDVAIPFRTRSSGFPTVGRAAPFAPRDARCRRAGLVQPGAAAWSRLRRPGLARYRRAVG